MSINWGEGLDALGKGLGTMAQYYGMLDERKWQSQREAARDAFAERMASLDRQARKEEAEAGRTFAAGEGDKTRTLSLNLAKEQTAQHQADVTLRTTQFEAQMKQQAAAMAQAERIAKEGKADAKTLRAQTLMTDVVKMNQGSIDAADTAYTKAIAEVDSPNNMADEATKKQMREAAQLRRMETVGPIYDKISTSMNAAIKTSGIEVTPEVQSLLDAYKPVEDPKIASMTSNLLEPANAKITANASVEQIVALGKNNSVAISTKKAQEIIDQAKSVVTGVEKPAAAGGPAKTVESPAPTPDAKPTAATPAAKTEVPAGTVGGFGEQLSVATPDEPLIKEPTAAPAKPTDATAQKLEAQEALVKKVASMESVNTPKEIRAELEKANVSAWMIGDLVRKVQQLKNA